MENLENFNLLLGMKLVVEVIGVLVQNDIRDIVGKNVGIDVGELVGNDI